MRIRLVRGLAALCAAIALSSVAWTSAWSQSSPSEATGPLGPLARYLLPAGGRLHFAGQVIERVAAGSYTYLRIEQPDGQRSWVVTLGAPEAAQLRAHVRVVAVGYAEHFTSKRLSRTFDDLYFAVIRAA